jgi:VLRF1 release factor-like protein
VRAPAAWAAESDGACIREGRLRPPFAFPTVVWMARYVGRENVRKRLAPLEGEPGRTSYADGAARIEHGEEVTVVRPPFGLEHEGEYELVCLEPLFEALAADHVVGALLVRLGGYAVGVFEGERLIASKVGSRFVKGRHKKGGSSANRFRRRREEQAKALVEEAAAVAARVLKPHLADIEFVAFGGDRFALTRTLAARNELAALEQKALPRFFSVPEPRKRVLERVINDIYSAQVTTGQRGESIPKGG